MLHQQEARVMYGNRIVGEFLYGSQNYGLSTPESDTDTKLIVVPSFQSLCSMLPPQNKVHFLANDEHLEAIDIRKAMVAFRKQNPNFVEILFSTEQFISDDYQEQWMRLVEKREKIARFNPGKALKAMFGMAKQREKKMSDPKSLYQILRLRDFIERYLQGESYSECLRPHDPEYLISVKKGAVNLAVVRAEAAAALSSLSALVDNYCATHIDYDDYTVDVLLDDVLHNIMRIALKEELQ